MKILLLLITAFTIPRFSFAQTSGPNDPGAAATVPSSACLACPGEIWNNETDVFLLDNNSAYAAVQPNGQCFQSNCYYTRYLFASNFGFNIPGTATINGITVDIYRVSGNTNSVTDSTVKLSLTGLPTGANRAITTAWPLAAAYYTYGSSTDLWGLSLTPADVNTATFGVFLKVYNQSNLTTTPTVNHIRITVDYTMSTGIHSSQTADPSAFNIYQNNTDLQVAFFLAGEAARGVLGIYDQLGSLVIKKELYNMMPGMHTASFSTQGLRNGMYFIRLESEGKIVTRKFFIQN
jgi:hypothetical protein